MNVAGPGTIRDAAREAKAAQIEGCDERFHLEKRDSYYAAVTLEPKWFCSEQCEVLGILSGDP
jgi:hypothetical protein